MRAAANHEIQSPGAQLVKNIQRRVWDAIQPSGVHPLRVSLMNVHDELIAVSSPDAVEDVAQVIIGTVEELREKVPLLAIDWRKNVRSWGEKNA
jgi:DNA polymerase I-like protein with 3'-5' exonuclease and polymerase domains